MDPLSLWKVLWRHRWLALPVVVLVLLLAGYAALFGPRTYESSAVYVVTNPDTPTDRELERDKRLAKLNSDNPYLRSADPALIAQVLVAKMSARSIELDLKAAGLSTDFSVGEAPSSSMTVVISAFADSPEMATASRQWLIDDMHRELYALQKVNGADDRFLFAALPVDVAPKPVEKISSRLRSLIVVLGAGVILLLGVLSLAAALDRRRTEQKVDAEGSAQASSPAQSKQSATENGALRPIPHQLRQPAQMSADQTKGEHSPAVVKLGGREGAGSEVVDAEASSEASGPAQFKQSATENGALRPIAHQLRQPAQVSVDQGMGKERPTVVRLRGPKPSRQKLDVSAPVQATVSGESEQASAENAAEPLTEDSATPVPPLWPTPWWADPLQQSGQVSADQSTGEKGLTVVKQVAP